MKTLTRSALVLALLGAATATAGCASKSAASRTQAIDDSSSTRESLAHLRASDAAIQRSEARFPTTGSASSANPAPNWDSSTPHSAGNATRAQGSTAPASTAAMHAGAAPAQSNAPLSNPARHLNLYGELEEVGPNAGAQLDGAVNLVQVSFATEGACIDPTIDRTGTLLAFASTIHRRTSDIYVKTVNGKTLTQITSDPADDVMPAFSPDATKVAFASNRSGNWDIYITGIDGGPLTQITSDVDHELHPSWSPDGRHLAYCRFGGQSGRWEIWTVEIANPGARRFLEYGVFPEWCPDVGRNKIVFQRAKQRGSRDYSIWTIDITNGQATQPTEIVSAANAALINPSWSPDGTRIAFVAVIDPQQDSARPKQSDVWVVNVDGANRTNLTSGQFANFQPVWARDGSVYFVSDRSGTDNVWAVKAGRHGEAGDKPQPASIVNADNDSSGPQR